MSTNITGVRHVGMYAKDPIAMSEFYQNVMGMTVVAQTPANSPMGTTIFLSLHPEVEGHHDLVIFSNPMFAHTAFRVEDLDEFLAFYQESKAKGVNIKFTFNHGVWFSFYIDDPEGHNLEFYWPTYVNAPVDYQVQPIDLSLPKEQLLAIADRMATKYGSVDADGNVTPPTNPNLELGNSSTGNSGNASQGAGNQGNAGQWGQVQGGVNQWNQNRGGTTQANPSQWSQGQGGANQWGQQGQGSTNQWSQGQGGVSQGNFGDWNKGVIDEFRANSGKVGMLPTPVLLITTTGRKSGKLYTTPVGYMIDADRLIVVPSSAKDDWYLNVLANPQVTVEVGTESFTATATLVEGEQRGIIFQRARKIADAAASAWRPPEAGNMADHVTEDGLVVALQRVDR